MPRERKGITPRKSKTLSETRFIIIASEGADTERLYFSTLNDSIKSTRLRTVQIEFLERGKNSSNSLERENERSKSGHNYVIKQLDNYKKEFSLGDNDELWLVIDRDSHNNTTKNIKNIAQKCLQKKYYLGLTNPNFEFWLLLHYKNIDLYSEQQKLDILNNTKVKNKKYIEQELSKVLGKTYDKSKYDAKALIPKIPFAIEQAEKLDNLQRWHEDSLGTKLHNLIKSIQK
jgi:hypothetical protein